MSIEEAIKQYLIPILSPVPIYYNHIPQGTPNPVVVYHLITGPTHHNIPVSYPTYQFDIYTDKPQDMINISSTIINALKQYKGAMVDIPVIQGVIENVVDIPTVGEFRRTIDTKIIYREAQ